MKRSSSVSRARAAVAFLAGVFWVVGELPDAQGNVTVRVDDNGNLIVEGDAADNGVSIKPFDVGEGEVLGLGTTLVNGSDRAPFSGAIGDFRFNMRGGNDTVVVDDGDGNETLGDLEIETGSGNDTVLIVQFIVHDDLSIRTGPGDDLVTLEQTAGNSPFVEDKTDIRTSSGNDQVLLQVSDFVKGTYLRFADEFEVSTGGGRDFVSIVGGLFLDEVDVNLGDGDDLGSLGGPSGGVCVCNSIFMDEDVLDHVVFSGGDGVDGGVIESVCGIAPPGLVDDFLKVEVQPDDCSFLGGVACKSSCEGTNTGG